MYILGRRARKIRCVMELVQILFGRYSARYMSKQYSDANELSKRWQEDRKAKAMPTNPKDPDTLTIADWPFGESGPVEFCKDGNILFAVKPEYYHTCDPAIVFYELEDKTIPEEERTLATIHEKFNELSIYNMKGEKIATVFKGREFISKMHDIGDWILMFSWVWHPDYFFGVVHKRDFFEEVYARRNEGVTKPTIGAFLLADNMSTDAITQATTMINAAIAADPAERNRRGLVLNGRQVFWYDKTGIYHNDNHFPYEAIYAGDVDVFEE